MLIQSQNIIKFIVKLEVEIPVQNSEVSIVQYNYSYLRGHRNMSETGNNRQCLVLELVNRYCNWNHIMPF